MVIMMNKQFKCSATEEMMNIYYLIQVIAAVAVINKSPVYQYEEVSDNVVNVHVACVMLLLLIF